MKIEKQKWKTSEIIKKYFYHIVKSTFNRELLSSDDMIDKNNFKDMLLYEILKLPEITPRQTYVDNLEFDREFIKQDVTQYQMENLKCFIKSSLDARFKLTQVLPYEENKDILIIASSFFNDINHSLKDELTNAANERRLFICKNKFSKYCAGTTYCVNNENYYKIDLNTISNPIFTLCHEIVHGYINIITKRKFDNQKRVILYREVASLLTEFYLNDYVLKNNLITKNEYVSNFNDFFCVAGYEDIEIIDVLYSICSDEDFDISEKNIINFIENKKQERLDYNFDVNELTEIPLKNQLIYFYSFMIAIGIYYKFKDNKSKGMNIAFEIIKSISCDNEEKVLNFYGINPSEAFKRYVDENNELIKKRND